MKEKKSINVNFLKISILLFIILISIMSFVGIYILKLNKLSNILPNYNFTSDIAGTREFVLSVDKSEEEQKVYVDKDDNIVGQAKEDSEGNIKEVEGYSIKTVNVKANNEEDLNTQNYEKTKEIIESRLKAFKVKDYKLRLDRQNGNIKLEMKQDKNTDMNYTLITSQGKFEVKDYQNGIVLMDNSNVNNVSVRQNATETGEIQIFLVVEFNKDGGKKLNEYSKKYVETVTDEESTINYITFELDGSTLYTTYFSEEWKVNEIYIPVSDKTSNTDEINEIISSAGKIANTINCGKMPIQYTLQTDNFVKSEITNMKIEIFKYAIISLLIVVLIVLSIKYKMQGFEIGFANIGFVALFSLIIRILKIEVAISSVIAIIAIIFMNIIFNILIIVNIDKKSFKELLKDYNLKIFPIIIVAIIYTLTININVSSIGMILFWGIVIFEIYNLLVTKALIKK